MERSAVNLNPAPHFKRLLACLLLFACGFCVHPASAALTDPAQIQTEAYVNLVQGDQSLDAGRLEEALSLYKTARDYYRQLARDFPDWEPRVIQYRMTYCDNQILDAERRLAGGGPAELPVLETPTVAVHPEPPPVAVTPPATVPTGDRSVEIDYLKTRIASLESELAEFDSLQDELEALTTAHAQLQQELAAANQKIAAGAGSEQGAVDALHAGLAAKDEQIQALQQEVENLKSREQALNDLEAQIRELTARNERLDQEIKTLDGELDDAEVRADQAELRAQQAEEQLAQLDARTRENAEKLVAAEARARQAEQDLEWARAAPASADVELTDLQREEPSASLDIEPAEVLPAPPAVETPIEIAVELPAPEPSPAPEEPLPPALPPRASVPPQPIPDNLSVADHVRQLLQADENEAALAAVREARKSAPADMNLALIEGIALIRLQQYNDAAALLIDLAKRNPRHAEIHATLGAAMMGAGFYDEARETLHMAVKLDPKLPECLYNLAQLHAFIQPVDLKQARRYYQQARNLGLAPDPQLDQILK